MRTSRLALLIVAAALLLPAVHASSPASDPTSVGQWVDASVDLAAPTLTTLDVNATFLVHKLTLNGQTYTAQDIADAYQGSNRFGSSTGQSFVDEVQSDVRDSLAATLSESFPAPDAVRVTSSEVDASSLDAARVDAYDPPIRVNATATVDRTAADAGLGSFTDAQADAALAAGAGVRVSLPLSSDPGYETTYTIHTPSDAPDAVWSTTSPGVTRDASQTEASASVDATTATAAQREAVQLEIRDAQARAPTAEDVRNTVDVVLGDIAPNATTLPLSATLTSQIASLDVAGRFPGSVPASVDLPFVDAHGIRLLHAAGVITDAQIDRSDASFRQTFESDLAPVFGSGVQATGGIDPADLAGSSASPLRFTASAVGSYAIPGSHAKDLELALAIGASVKLNLTLDGGADPTTFVLHAPRGTVFSDARDGGVVAVDGASVSFVVPAGEASAPAAVSLRNATAPVYARDDESLDVTVDLQKLDVSLGGLAKRDFGTLHVAVDVAGRLGVLGVDKLPASAQAQLSDPSIDLQYLSSDAIRLLLQRGLVTPEDVAQLDALLLNETATDLAASLGAPVQVDGGLDASSLAPGAASGSPIVFRASADFTKPLSGGASSSGQAVALYTLQQSFAFPRIQSLDTTYTVILPRGLALSGVTATGGDATTGRSPDGRDEMRVTPTSGSAEATMEIAVTPTFVFLQFWPLVLGAVFLLVLAVGTPVAIVVLRRRKRGGAS